MAVKKMPSLLDRLPTFTYTKTTKQRRRAIHKAVSFYKSEKIFPRYTAQNVIDLARWKGEDRPRGYPSNLKFPEDVLKAALFSKKHSQRRNTSAQKHKKRTTTRSEGYQIINRARRCASCFRTANTASALCQCTTAPWDIRNTKAWRELNIALRWVDDSFGVGAYALSPFKKGAILGEYVGELVPDVETIESRYLFGIDNEDNETIAHIDSLRVGG